MTRNWWAAWIIWLALAFSGHEIVNIGPAAVCGDGVTAYAEGEQCDDGNTNNDDGCSSFCIVEYR